MAALKGDVLVWFLHFFAYSLLTLLFGLGLHKILAFRRKTATINLIPGPRGVPILGNTLDFIVEPREFFQRCMGFIYIWGFHSPIARFWGVDIPVVDLYKAHTAEVLLSSQKHIEKSRDYVFLHPWLGTGLLTSTGRKWFSRRKMLTPAFHFKILEDFIDVFHSQSNVMISKLKEKANGTAFDVFPYITLCTLDIIFESALGCTINAQGNSESEYVKAVYSMSSVVQKRQARPWLQPDILFKLFGEAKKHDDNLKILHETAYKAIRERRKQFKISKQSTQANGHVKNSDDEDVVIGKKRRLAFLDLMLESAEDEAPLTDVDIREEVDTFMFEGHDTTAAAINWSLYLLGCYPKIQEKVYNELLEVFGDTDRPATMADLRQLKYTENCIKEALRLFPSVPMFAREIKEELVVENYRIPAGTTIVVLPYRLHRDPEHFPMPEVYDPDRFLPENCKNRHPYAYIPFSAGARNCIGKKFALMEEKVVISNVLRNFRVESTVRREDMRILGELVLRPEKGNMLKFYPRK